MNSNMEYRYDIEQFEWNPITKEFSGYMEDLHYSQFIEPWPNQAKQFFIVNHRTRDFRRFRLIRDNNIEYVFESEDGIQCRIIKNKKKETRIQKLKSIIAYNYNNGYLLWLKQLVDSITF